MCVNISEYQNKYACVAQLVVQLIRNEQVAGSSPVTSSIEILSHSHKTAVRNSFTYPILILYQVIFCIFAVRGFIDSLQTLRNTRRQGNRSDRRTKVRRGAVDAVSKNAFAQP